MSCFYSYVKFPPKYYCTVTHIFNNILNLFPHTSLYIIHRKFKNFSSEFIGKLTGTASKLFCSHSVDT